MGIEPTLAAWESDGPNSPPHITMLNNSKNQVHTYAQMWPPAANYCLDLWLSVPPVSHGRH